MCTIFISNKPSGPDSLPTKTDRVKSLGGGGRGGWACASPCVQVGDGDDGGGDWDDAHTVVMRGVQKTHLGLNLGTVKC